MPRWLWNCMPSQETIWACRGHAAGRRGLDVYSDAFRITRNTATIWIILHGQQLFGGAINNEHSLEQAPSSPRSASATEETT